MTVCKFGMIINSLWPKKVYIIYCRILGMIKFFPILGGAASGCEGNMKLREKIRHIRVGAVERCPWGKSLTRPVPTIFLLIFC